LNDRGRKDTHVFHLIVYVLKHIADQLVLVVIKLLHTNHRLFQCSISFMTLTFDIFLIIRQSETLKT